MNYYNFIIDKIKADYSLADQQSFTAVSAESNSPIGDIVFRWNGYDLQTYDKTWSNNNPMREKFFSGLWIPKEAK